MISFEIIIYRLPYLNQNACIIAVLLSSLLLFKWAIGPRALLYEKRGSIPTSWSVTDCSPSPALTDLSGKSIACYNPASCTASICCMEIDRFNGRSIEVDLDFNECANYMDLTLERVHHRKYITDLSLNGMLNSISQILICYLFIYVSAFLKKSLSKGLIFRQVPVHFISSLEIKITLFIWQFFGSAALKVFCIWIGKHYFI